MSVAIVFDGRRCPGEDRCSEGKCAFTIDEPAVGEPALRREGTWRRTRELMEMGL